VSASIAGVLLRSTADARMKETVFYNLQAELLLVTK
jgi:hypothetical protein